MNSNPVAEKLTFWQLVEKSKIEIPIIQRDYAQGRKDKAEIRSKFLDALLNALEDENFSELDFIYGSQQANCLQPLDGQQRLTTLFLLHWYVAAKEKVLAPNSEVLKKFTYETRTSSREFCNQIVENGIDFDRLLESDNDTEGESLHNSLSKTIIDSSWFFLSWQKDPTIDSMLTMLDAIHQKYVRFKDRNDIWTRLTVKNKITFLHIPLNHFGLSDDLYIKMNARGKALTDFENFKAKFEQYIIERNWEDGLILNDYFSHKIDSGWTDLFWKYKDKNHLIDNDLVKFIAGIAINNYAQNLEIYEDFEVDKKVKSELTAKSKGNPVSSEAIKRERIEKRIAELFNDPKKIKPEDFPSKKGFDFLKSCFDIYAKKLNNKISYDELLPENLPLWDYCSTPESTIFKELIKSDVVTYKQRVLFFAQTLAIRDENFEPATFSEWMRVVRNIVHNSTIDSATSFIGAIGLIKEISSGIGNIYQYLSSNSPKSSFASNQVSEEILKAKINQISSANKQAIFQTEDTNFCKGKITFALYCIGVFDSKKQFDADKLSDLRKVIEYYLNEADLKNDFRRALLTIKGNDFYNYWGMGTWSHNTDSSKRCLIENTTDLKNYFTEGYYKDYLCDLLKLLIEKPVSEVIDGFLCPANMPNWKKRLIKEPGFLDEHCQSKYIGIPTSEDFCYLFGRYKRPRVEDCYKLE
jgi:Protein of unknown function DUF262